LDSHPETLDDCEAVADDELAVLEGESTEEEEEEEEEDAYDYVYDGDFSPADFGF
jgi:hypothetical protein